MHDVKKAFIPAAGHDWLLPFYDPLLRFLRIDFAHRQLVQQAELRPACRVLDIGCGTGNLAIHIRREHPEVDVVALDPDPKALARARRKAQKAGVAITFDQGFSQDLPYPDQEFDRVFSSFMLHHLDMESKRQTLAEAHRVLLPTGSFHLLDFGGSSARSDGLIARLLHNDDSMHSNFQNQVVGLITDANFVDAAEVASRKSIAGQIAFYSATATPRASASNCSGAST